MKFKSDIEIQAGVEAGGGTGSSGQVLSSTGSGVAWIDQSAVSADSAESVHISVKNTSGAQILKGTPVYVTGETGNSGKIEIAPADASDSDKMPALGLLESTLNNNGEGFCVQGGLLEALATATIDGTATTSNDTVYVKPGGGLTMTKPTGTGLIQNIAKVARVHASNGSLVVSSILRTNDVPNLPEGRIWVGDGNTIVSDTVYVDEPNNRVGIGTDSPSQKLEVVGNIQATGARSISSSFDANHYMRIESNSSGGVLKGTDGGVITTLVRTYGDSYFNGGNVGIGTTSPSAKLHVTDGSGGDIAIGTNTTAVKYLNFGLNSDYSIQSNGGSYLRFHTEGSERIRIDSAGNVGIGTTSPDTNLEIGAATNVAPKIRLTLNDSGNSIGLGQEYGSMQWKGNDGQGDGVRADIRVFGEGTSGQTYMTLGTMPAGTSASTAAQERMRITSTGNVGIGTTNPDTKLHVEGNVLIDAYNQGEDNGLFFREGFLTIDQPSITVWDMSNGGASPDGLSINANDGIRFRENGGEVARFKDGNFGIGTTNPQGKLEVQGSAPFIYITDDTETESGIIFRDLQAGMSQAAAIKFSSGDNKLRFYNNDTTAERMVIDVSGNVGIGTTSPGAKFHVNTSDTIKFLGTNADYVAGSIGSGVLITTGGSTGNTYSQVYGFQSGNTAYANLVVPGGNVGIGTTSPGAKLDIINSSLSGMFRLSNTEANATTKYSAIVGRHYTNTEENVTGMLITSSSSATGGSVSIGGGISTSNAVNNVLFYTAANNTTLTGTERMRIDSSGNVGIGTTSPSTKLEVNDSANDLQMRVGSLTAGISPSFRLQGKNTANTTNYYADIELDAENGKLIFNDPGTSSGSIGQSPMVIDSSGNVGIGTTSPGAKLQVGDGSFDANARVLNSDSTYTEMRGWGIVTNRTGSYYRPANDKTQVLAIGNDGNTWNYISQNANYHTFGKDTSEWMRIDTSGNVGIGTTSPSEKLDVEGGVNISDSLQFTGSGTGSLTSNGLNEISLSVVDSNDGNNPDNFLIKLDSTGDGAFYAKTLELGDVEGVENETKITIDSTNSKIILANGNVGIGTTTPTAPLHIEGGTNSEVLKIEANSNPYIRWVQNGTNVDFLQFSSNNAYLANTSNGSLFFRTNNTDRLVISSTGNVGIGATSPANKLDVVGISRFTHSSSTSYRGAIETVVDNAFPTWDIGWLHARTGSSTYGNIARFNDQNGSQIGGIFYSGASGTSFVTTSDYRLKENIKEISDSISRVKKLKPCRFNFATEKNRVIDGFIAHEVQEVVPEAVHGEKDALQKDGSINAQTLEVSRLIPVLTKALQEAINKIEELELRIQTIENN